MKFAPVYVTVCAISLASCSSDDNGKPRVAAPIHAANDSAARTEPDPDSLGKLRPEDAAPYFTSEIAARAAKLYALEEYAAAGKAFAEHLSKEKPTGADEGRARLMLGLCYAATDRWSEAAQQFSLAEPKIPLLADYINYHAARAYFRQGDRKRAREFADKVAPNSIVGADALLLLGDLLRITRARPAKIANHYQGYIDQHRRGPRLSEARFHLANALVEQGQAEKALALWRRITVAAPLSRWAERAQKRIAEVLANKKVDLSSAIRKQYQAPLNAEELITRGMVFFTSMRNSESEADFRQALSLATITPDQACVAAYHHAQSVFKQRQRQRAAPLFDAASAACQKTENADLQVKSAYQAGRSYANAGVRDTAIDRYRAAETLHPEHSYADDARLRQAEEFRDQGKEAQVSEYLQTIPEKYPQGDMRAEALWRLAWRAFKAKRYRESIQWLEKQQASKPIDDNYWAEGQPQYWLGRAWAELGDSKKSLASYTEAVRKYPMSYYALLALNRLREKHPKEFATLYKEIAPTPRESAPPPSFKPRAVYKKPGFERALEFLRLGLGDSAAAELSKLGLSSPPGKNPLEDADKAEKVWAMAFLYNRAGKYGPSHWVMRWHVLNYKRHWPNGKWRVYWDVAYPQAWWPLLDQWASKRGHPTELQISFVREESAFNPILESYANAIGLTQMIYSTASRFAKGTGISINRRNFRETLRDPEKNVIIGSNFLDFLMKRFEGRIALVVPSYNAGEGATYKWLRLRGSWPQDEWSEEIPYDQARRYAKRVIASYFAYAFLKDGTIPEMPNNIPKSVLPK